MDMCLWIVDTTLDVSLGVAFTKLLRPQQATFCCLKCFFILVVYLHQLFLMKGNVFALSKSNTSNLPPF